MAQHLKKVGLKITVKQIDSALWGTRTAANEIQATLIWDVQPMWADNTWTDYTPSNSWAPLWNLWYTSGGKQGEEPPAAVKALYDILEGRNQAIPYSDADKKLKDDLYKNYGENVLDLPAGGEGELRHGRFLEAGQHAEVGPGHRRGLQHGAVLLQIGRWQGFSHSGAS